METPARVLTRGLALGALVLLGGTSTATAHEHHMDNIAEGSAVSDDPIVGSWHAGCWWRRG
jgi:hypothetical protein